MELVDILCLQANIYLVSFNFEITSLLFLSHSRLASILCQTCCVPLNHHNSNHIKLSISILHITNTFINYYDEGAHAKFSLSRRDGDSNRFLPSWGIIPNTHPYSPRWGHIRSPLVQLRSKSWVRPVPYPQRYYQSARRLGTRTHPWTHAIGSPHIFTASRVHTLTACVLGLS